MCVVIFSYTSYTSYTRYLTIRAAKDSLGGAAVYII